MALNRPIVRFVIGSSSEAIQLQLILITNGVFSQPIPLGDTPYNVGLTFLTGEGFISIDRTDLYLDSVTPTVTETAADTGVACTTTTAPAVGWTSPDGLTWTHPTHGSYTLSVAPFPLSGWLATTTEAGHLNYAGTSSATVRTAIEDNLDD